MSKITSVEPQKNNPRRFNLFLDGQFAFGVNEDLVVNFRLVVGRVVEEDELNKLLFEAEVGKLMERMYRLLNIRPRSEKETRDYLRNLSFKRKLKGKEAISDLATSALISRLKQKGWLSDEEFAQSLAEARIRQKKGLVAIRIELLKKGIDREIIERVTQEKIEAVDIVKLAEQALEKRSKIWSNLPRPDFIKKSLNFLLRRGFTYSVSKTAVENFLQKR